MNDREDIVRHYYCFEYYGEYFTFDTFYYIVVKMSKRQQQILDLLDKGNNIKSGDNIEDQDLQIIHMCLQKGLFISELNSERRILKKDIGSVSFTPTHCCNLNCKYCFANHGDNFIGEDRNLSRKVIETAIDFFCNGIYSKCNNIRIDLVGGGENFLNPEAIENILNCLGNYNKNFLVWICTNGTIVNENVARILSYKNVLLGVSLDGNKKQNDMNRIGIHGESVYQNVVDNIYYIRNELSKTNPNLKDLWGLVVVTSRTTSLIDVLRHHDKIGFSSVQMKLERSKNLMDESECDKICDLYKELTEFFIEEISQGRTHLLKMILNDNDYYGKVQKRLILNTRCINRCSAGSTKFAVDAKGNIFPCDSFVGLKEFVLGNVFHSKNKLESSAFYNLSVDERKPCKDCWAKEICGGDCLHDSYLQEGSIFHSAKKFCKIQKKIIEYNVILFERICQKEVVYNDIQSFLEIRERIQF